MRFSFVLLLVCVLARVCQAQSDISFLYGGLGYKIAYPFNGALNSYLDEYNSYANKGGGRLLQDKFPEFNLLHGPDAIAALRLNNQRLIYETRLSYRTGRVEASGSFNDKPGMWEEAISYRQYGFGIGYLYPLYHDEYVQLTGGGYFDFSAISILHQLQSPERNFHEEIIRRGNFALTPALHFYVQPFYNSNLLIGFRPYCQINLFPIDYLIIEDKISTDNTPNYQSIGAKKSPTINAGLSLEIMFKSRNRKKPFLETFIRRIKLKRTYKRKLKAYKQRIKDQKNYITLYGEVRSSTDSSLIPHAFVVLVDETGPKTANLMDASDSARYSMFITSTKDRRYIAQAHGFMPRIGQLEKKKARKEKEANYELDIYMEPIARGKQIHLPIGFKGESEELTEATEYELQTILEFMAHNPKVKLEIVGYPGDHTGKDKLYPEKLMKSRLKVIRYWLDKNGIRLRRFKISVKDYKPDQEELIFFRVIDEE